MESRTVVTMGPGRGGDGELLFNGYRFSVWDDERVWRYIVVMVAQQCKCA